MVLMPAINAIPLLDVAKEVRAIAKEFPDYKYRPTSNGCQYKPDHKNPNGCIIGFAYRRLGVDVLDHGRYGPITELHDWYHDERDQIVAWLSAVQGQQDSGHTWSQAVHVADECWADWAEAGKDGKPAPGLS
jgi:hypothetical protein